MNFIELKTSSYQKSNVIDGVPLTVKSKFKQRYIANYIS